MLDMGFIPDIEKVIAQLPKDRRNSFFSATVPKAVEDLAKEDFLFFLNYMEILKEIGRAHV